MKIFHCADLHYAPKHLERVDRAFGFAVDHAIQQGAELAIIAGDVFDSTMSIHEPSLSAVMTRISTLAQHMPVVIINGTFSHDRPGSLEMFRFIGGRYQVHIVDKPMQIHVGICIVDERQPMAGVCIVNCFPSINKAMPEIAAAGGPAAWVSSRLADWAVANREHRQNGGISILVSHGTVVGCKTESGHAMISPDHEFSCETLLSSGVDAVMLGHIHLHQHWNQVVYSGSIAKLVFGHNAPTGFVMWEVSPEGVYFEFVPAPSPEMVEIIFNGQPDMDILRELAATSQGAMVRIRSQVDEEFAQFVDRQSIMDMFAGAEKVSLDVSVNPVQRVRASGISKYASVRDRLRAWAKSAELLVELDDLLDRYDTLQINDMQQIVQR